MIQWLNFKKGMLLVTVILLVITGTGAAKDPPLPSKVYDFTAGDTLPEKASHDWTLGETGARGWFQVGEGGAEGNTTPSRQILITEVSNSGPAAKILQKGDVILGIGDGKFESDARISFAKALGAAHSSDGRLVLQRFRNDQVSQVSIQLSKLPSFSETAPYDCEKSKILFDRGCAALAQRGLRGRSIASDINALTLLASGEKKYIKIVKDYAHQRVQRPLSPEMGLPCWSFAFSNLFLCEYYLITKDRKVLPEIERLSQHLVDGRGPLSTWGHSFVDPTNQRLRGYGAVNAVGVPVVMSLTLAKECGVKIKDMDKTLVESARFFRRHVGLGTIPYGDGPPSTRYGHDDNGKNSAAAVFFNLLEDTYATRYYTRTAMAAYGSDREQGHTGNFFNMLWSLPAVALGGPESTGMWLNEFGWYYDLARDPEHRYPYQGYAREGARRVHASWDCPGAYLLHFSLEGKQLRITGRNASCITAFTTEENKATIRAARISYKEASDEVLNEALSSWSPVARIRAEREMRKRKTLAKVGFGLGSTDPLEREAAVKSSSNFKACSKMLEDKDLRVRLAAMKMLSRIDKDRALESVFDHLVGAKEESPVFTQNVCDTFFSLGSRGSQIGKTLLSVKKRKLALAAISKLLDDEDCLVSSRVAMGVAFLPEREQKKLLAKIYERAQNPPAGNVMFNNSLRVSCVEVLAKWELQEGMDLAVELLRDQSWGRNARLPRAAAAVSSYGGHAKAFLPKLEETSAQYKSGDKWKALIEKVIAEIKKSPAEKNKLKSVRQVSSS